MADMYGTLRSTRFRVKDPAAFKAWFEKECTFSCEYEITEEEGEILVHGAGLNPRALPDRMMASDEDEDDCDIDEWDPQEFAAALRSHLTEPQDVLMMAAGNYKGRPVASFLAVPKEGKAFFLELTPGNDSLPWIRAQMVEATKDQPSVAPSAIEPSTDR